MRLPALLLALALPAAAGPAPKAPDMSKRPALGPWKTFAAPARSRWTLPNGLRVLYVRSEGAPLVSVRLAVRGGTALGGDRDAGLVEAMAELLTEGTETRSALALAEAADAAGGSVGAAASSDHVVVTGEGLAEKAGEVLDLLADAALHPSFPEAEVELRKRNMLEEIRVRESEPAWLAETALARTLYGSHPYAVHGPTPASVARIDRGAVRRLHKRLFSPENAVLAAVGPLPEEDLRAKVEAAFAAWPTRAELPEPPLPAPARRSGRAVVFHERPGAAQSAAAFGVLAAREDDPDYAALLVADMVLGGSFAARLTTDLREEKGWTYGIYSKLDQRLASGAFTVHGQFRGEVTRPAVDAVLGHLARLAKAPPSAAELEQAKANLAGEFVRGLETQEGLLGEVLHDALFGLPDDRLERHVARVRAVTAAQAQAAAKRWVAGDGLVVAVVGDAAAGKALESFGVTRVGADGKPLPPAK